MDCVRSLLLSMLALASGVALGCSRTQPPSGQVHSSTSAKRVDEAGPLASAPPSSAVVPAVTTPARASVCTPSDGPTCFRFDAVEDAFRWVLASEPLVLAIGEAHAQRGTENIASSTKRFTESFLPMLAPRSSDVVVELWAPNPTCMKAVKQIESAQKPVTEVQAETNQNEYLTLGTRAKSLGMTPWLLRPTCDDFSMLADAGADGIGAMLGLVKRLTQAKVSQLYERNRARSGDQAKMIVAYGGALHNDRFPSEATREYSFGPELDQLTDGRYVELDLIVPEYVKKTPVWEKLPWYAAFEADRSSGPVDKATVYVVRERSFVLLFPISRGLERAE